MDKNYNGSDFQGTVHVTSPPETKLRYFNKIFYDGIHAKIYGGQNFILVRIRTHFNKTHTKRFQKPCT